MFEVISRDFLFKRSVAQENRLGLHVNDPDKALAFPFL